MRRDHFRDNLIATHHASGRPAARFRQTVETGVYIGTSSHLRTGPLPAIGEEDGRTEDPLVAEAVIRGIAA